jgi:hypothetical protein
MNRDLLDGRTSSTNRAFASDRTIKISDSIATTFGLEILGQNITETLVIAAQLAPADFVLLAGGGEHQIDVFEYVHEVSFRGGAG